TMIAASAHAIDRGQFNDVPDDIRAWFKRNIRRNGVPCCEISDAHRTEYDVRNGAYRGPIDGAWTGVPPRAVIRDPRSPVPDPGATHALATAAAKRAAAEQRVPGRTEVISYEDEKGQWHEETASGSDRPNTNIIDKS